MYLKSKNNTKRIVVSSTTFVLILLVSWIISNSTSKEANSLNISCASHLFTMEIPLEGMSVSNLQGLYEVDKNTVALDVFNNGFEKEGLLYTYTVNLDSGGYSFRRNYFDADSMTNTNLSSNSIFAESHVDSWKLVLENGNIYLLGKNNFQIEILSFIPKYHRWVWSLNDNYLWYWYATGDVGHTFLMVDLTATPPQVIENNQLENMSVEQQRTLEPIYNNVRYDPLNEKIWWRTSTGAEKGQIYTYDLRRKQLEKLANLEAGFISWEPNYNTIMLFQKNDDFATLSSFDGTVTVQIPNMLLEDTVHLSSDTPFIALSDTLLTSENEYLVWRAGAEIYVYACDES